MTKTVQILLVDDEVEFLDTLAERVRAKGYEPILAKSGEEAVEIAKCAGFDAAVVDLKMPGMDGLKTIETLKSFKPGLPTVLLTGYGDAKVQEATEALEAVCCDKGEMGAVWTFLKGVADKIERTLAAAGMAEGAASDDAVKLDSGDQGDFCKTKD